MEFLNPIWSHQVVPRVTSVYPYANALGLYLAPIIILLGVYLKSLLKDKGKLYQIVALIVVIIMSLASIIFSRTEGAMLGVLAGSILFFALSSRRGLWLTAVVLALGLVAIVSVPSWRSVAWEKVSLSDLSGEIRQAQWLETKQMLMASPVNFIFGVGLNNYPVRVLPFHQEGIFYNFDKLPYEEFRNNLVNGSYLYKRAYWKPVQIYQYPHNIILNFWTELGILGVALMLWLLARFFYLSLKIYYQHRDVLALGLASAMVTVLVHGLVDVPYFKNDLAVLWWILFAILAVIKLDYDY
jgi:O-antigen ligase